MSILPDIEIVKRELISPLQQGCLLPYSYLLCTKGWVRLDPITNTFTITDIVETINIPAKICALIIGYTANALVGLSVEPLFLSPTKMLERHPRLALSLRGGDPVSFGPGDIIAQIRFDETK